MKKVCQKMIVYVLVFAMMANCLPLSIFAKTGESKVSNNEAIEKTEVSTPKVVKPVFEKGVYKTPEIVREITEKREMNKKHYLMNDGSIMVAMYPSNIHYKEKGVLKDIDNTLVSNNDEYGIKNNSFDVKFSKKMDSTKILTMSNKGYSIQWSLDNSKQIVSKLEKNKIPSTEKQSNNDKKMVLDKLTSTIIYEDVFSDTDLKYDIIPEQVKESIVLKNAKAVDHEFTFNLKTAGLEAKLESTNTIVVFNPQDNEEIFIINAPFMYDTKLEFSDSIKLSLTKNETGYSIKLEPDKEWLKDESRVYPIVIDPTLTTSRNYDQIEDTYIYNNDTNNTTKGTAHILRVGNNTFIDTGRMPFRSLVKFNLPVLDAGDQVIKADLRIYNYPDDNNWNPPAGNIQIDIHKMTANWTENDARWNNLKDSYDPKIVDYFDYYYTSSNPTKENYMDITSIAKDWYVTGNNYGLMIKEHVEGTVSGRQDMYFLSADTNASVYYNLRPVATITYRNQTGLEDYLTYHEQNVGRAGNLYTNDYNGNLVLIHNDASTPGNRLPVSIYHVYNTNDKGLDIGYGNGFRLNLSQTVEILTAPLENYAKYIDEDGTKHYLYKEGTTYYDEDGLGLELKLNGNFYIMTDKTGNKSSFEQYNGNWRLKTIVDVNNNQITINYTDSHITSVTDAVGNSLILTYTNNLLSNIKDSDNKYTYYNYTGTNLTSITYSDNQTSTYTYNNNLIISVENIDNSKISYDYYPASPYRVKKITEYSTDAVVGNYLNITYGNNYTVFEDNLNFSNNYIFNNYGQTTSITDLGDNDGDNSNAYGKAYYYYADGARKNKLGLETSLISSTNNYAWNTSAEEDFTCWWPQHDSANQAGLGITTQSAYMGNKSFKVVSNYQENIKSYYDQSDQAVPKGVTYTFSAYVKTENIQTNTNGGALLHMWYIDTSGNLVNKYSDVIVGTNDWTRISLTFDIPANITGSFRYGFGINEASGVAYFDAVQLEIGNLANTYNLLANNNFYYNNYFWGGNGVVSTDGPVSLDGNVAYKMTDRGAKNIYQQINVNGKKGDVFNLSLFAKANAVPTYNDKSVDIRIQVLGVNNEVQWDQINVNPDSSEWQFLSGDIIANHDYKRIDVYLCYYHNSNEVYFDNVGLYKDVQGNSYTYDGSGNVISSKDSNKINTSLAYSGRSELLSSSNLKGSNYSYEYDFNNSQRLLKATSTNNLKYAFGYDQYGNNTSLKIESNLKEIDVLNGKSYYIKSNSSGKYVDVEGIGVNNDTLMQQYSFHGGPNQVFIVTNITDDYFKVVPAHVTSRALTLNASNNIVIYDYNGSDNQLWKFIKNVDGTYKIVSKLDNTKVMTIQNNSKADAARIMGEPFTNSENQSFILYDASKTDAYNDALIEENEIYYIRSKSSNLYLDFNGSTNTEGVKLVQKKQDKNSKNQMFRIAKSIQDTYTISPISSNYGLLLDVLNNTNNNITQLKSATVSSLLSQRWKIVKNTDGTFSVRSALDGTVRYLTVYNNGMSEGQDIVINDAGTADNQKFYLEKANITDVEDGTYKIKGKYSNLYVGVRGGLDQSGTMVEQQNQSDSLTQQWQFVNLHNGYFKIIPKHTQNNMVLDVEMAWTHDGTRMQICVEWGGLTNYAQQFEIVSDTDGSVVIKPRLVLGRSALDVKSPATNAGDQIQLWTSNGSSPQRFYLEKVSEPSDNPYIETNATYSDNGMFLNTVTDALDNTTEYTYNYDATNKSGTLASVKDAKDNIVSYGYDTLGRVTSTSSNNHINSYTYLLDKLDTITHNGFDYEFNYDTYGNISNIKVANQTLVTNTYEANNGNLTSVLYGNNQGISYQYDRFNRTSKKVANDATYEYYYDNRGNIGLTKDITNNYQYNYTYDLADRLVSIKGNNNYNIDYSYDDNSNLSNSTYKLNTNTNNINYIYDKNSRINNIKFSNNTLSYNYDTLSRLDNKQLKIGSNSYQTKYEYLTNGNKTSTILSSIQNGTNDKISYQYDANGNIEKTLVNNVEKIKYYYDALNQLIKEDNTYLNKTIEYNYDLGGNITSKEEYEYQTTTLLDTINYSYASDWKDKLISYDNKAITYDNIGNPLTYDGNTYEWINGRQLKSITKDSNAITYKYNDNGIRTEKTVNGVTTKYYLEGTKVIYEVTGDNTIYYVYDEQDNIIGLKYNNTEYYYQKNGQNDIIGLLDAALTQVVSYEYDSWGNLISIKDNSGNTITDPTNIGLINPYRYRSYRYDTETAMYYLQSRYYSSDWGRFINADTVMNAYGTLANSNMYSYTDNNPINRSDDSGNFWDTLLDIFGLGASYSDYVKNPSLKTFGWLASDVGLSLVPFVPNTGGIRATAKIVKTTNKVNKIDTAHDLGKSGENAVSTYLDLKKNTEKINMFGNNRIPDFIDSQKIYEVKNVSRLSYTKQLRDYKKYADLTGKQMDLFVRPGTKISNPLARSGINIRWDVPFK